jgi:hypothetical protein
MSTGTIWRSLLVGVTLIAGAALPAAQALAAKADEAAATASLSEAEAASLLFMREEEKLARDVYQLFFSLYADQTFYNIALSEDRHTSQVRVLIETYGLADPAATNPPRVFANPVLQDLYNALTDRGRVSLTEALYVGGLIEEKDIIDIATSLEKIDNKDIVTVYTNLMDGSKNHLRSFVARIESIVGAYKPQLLSEEEFNAIVN